MVEQALFIYLQSQRLPGPELLALLDGYVAGSLSMRQLLAALDRETMLAMSSRPANPEKTSFRSIQRSQERCRDAQ